MLRTGPPLARSLSSGRASRGPGGLAGVTPVQRGRVRRSEWRTCDLNSPFISFISSGADHEATRSLTIRWADAYLHITAKRRQPRRQLVNRHAFHSTAQDLGKCGLVGVTALCRFDLGQLLFTDGFGDGMDKFGLRHSLLSLGFAKAKIAEDVITAGANGNLTARFFCSSASGSRARFKRCSITAISSRGMEFC